MRVLILMRTFMRYDRILRFGSQCVAGSRLRDYASKYSSSQVHVVRHMHLISNISFSICFPLAYCAHYNCARAVIRNRRLAHFVTNARGAYCILYRLVMSCSARAFSARYFMDVDNSRPVHGATREPQCVVYIPTVITDAFYTPTNIADPQIAWAR